jgi:hypothetical protein
MKTKVITCIFLVFMFSCGPSSEDVEKAEEVAKEHMGLATQCCGFCYYGAQRGLELSTLSVKLSSGSVELSSEIDNAKKQKLCMSSCKLGFDSYHNGLSEKEMVSVLVGTFREAARRAESK